MGRLVGGSRSSLCTFYLDAKITDPYAFFDTFACDVRSLKILARSLNVSCCSHSFFLRVFAFAVFTAFLLGSQLGSAQVGTG